MPPDPEQPEEATAGKSLLTGGIILVALGAGSAGISYYSYDTRRKAESSLALTEQSNELLVAAGLQPQSTNDLEQKIKLNRGLFIGTAIGAAVLLVTGGVLLLVGSNRRKQQQSRPITWRPRMTGIEVAF